MARRIRLFRHNDDDDGDGGGGGNYNAVLANTTTHNPIVVCRVNCIDSIQLRVYHEFPPRCSAARGYRRLPG